jgi:hypothetical protein
VSQTHTHEHTHEHEHEHHDGHGHVEDNRHAGQGAVLLDIGGDVGALVVTMPAATIGEEVEILGEHVPAGQHRPHVAVVDRPVPGGDSVPSLVFPELTEGSYALVPKGTDDVRLRVDVRGGEVTTAVWPG